MKFLLSVPPSLANYAGAAALLAEAAGANSSNGGSNNAQSCAGRSFHCWADPSGTRLGSGGGTAHLLEQCYAAESNNGSNAVNNAKDATKGSLADATAAGGGFDRWLRGERRVLVHAGGQSRRLPSYAPGAGKLLTPLPPFAGLSGQRVDQTLLSLQLPLLEGIAAAAPPHLNTLVACGDVLLWPSNESGSSSGAHRWFSDDDDAAAASSPGTVDAHGSGNNDNDGIDDASAAAADVVCFGVPCEVSALRNHGALFARVNSGNCTGTSTTATSASASGSATAELAFMLQKPTASAVHRHLASGGGGGCGPLQCWLDVGLWLLSVRAVGLLMARAHGIGMGGYDGGGSGDGTAWQQRGYDLYSDFGLSLGSESRTLPSRNHHHPSHRHDLEVSALRARVAPLPGLDFYHFGTTAELVSATLRVNRSSLQQGRRRGDGNGNSTIGCSSSSSIWYGGYAPSRSSICALPALSPSPSALSPSPVREWISAAHPTVIVNNALVHCPLSDATESVWIESSCVGPRWRLADRHVVTGVPRNDWTLSLPSGVCLGVVPVRQCGPDAAGDDEGSDMMYTARPYGYSDSFHGDIRPPPPSEPRSSNDKGADPLEPASFLGRPLASWLSERGLDWRCLLPPPPRTSGSDEAAEAFDIQFARLFPCVASTDSALLGGLIGWMIHPPPPPLSSGGGGGDDGEQLFALMRAQWLSAPRLSASDLNDVADVQAVAQHRESFQRELYAALGAAAAGGDAASVPSSGTGDVVSAAATVDGFPAAPGAVVAPYSPVQTAFYDRVDLSAAADRFAALGVQLALPSPSSTAATAEVAAPPPAPAVMTFIQQSMFHARYVTAQGRLQRGTDTSSNTNRTAAGHELAAFAALRTAMAASLLQCDGPQAPPRLAVHADQIVWARCPARVDLSGGWTDTPPYSVTHGGAVVNIAVELNGQPPIQAYVRLHEGAPVIILRSIDLGAQLVVETFDDLRGFDRVGCPFSIPKAALALAGFLPEFSSVCYGSLNQQLAECFAGSGLEVTLLVAIPAGSGLGTSSLLAGTLLRALADFCGLRWGTEAVCRRVLTLEQLLTTGGGWQDPFGGLCGGVKLVESRPGLAQDPTVHWLSDRLFTCPELAPCHLLYYTGITRTAKSILAEIVRGMFLNDPARLAVLAAMQAQARGPMCDAVARGDYPAYGRLLARAWGQNRALDAGTSTPPVSALMDRVAPLAHGAKLAGAGGGGYMLIAARDPECAARIRADLVASPPNARARFVDMRLSPTGIQASRS